MAGGTVRVGPDAGTVYIFDGASGSSGYFPQFKKRKYIDCFAGVVRHEARHRQHLIDYWGLHYSDVYDFDLDGLRDNAEAVLRSMINEPYDMRKADTDGDGLSDFEDYASTAEKDWVDGSADGEDWAMPGTNSKK